MQRNELVLDLDIEILVDIGDLIKLVRVALLLRSKLDSNYLDRKEEVVSLEELELI